MRTAEKCIKCNGSMQTANRTGVCVNCRTVKCAAPKCEEVMIVKSFGNNYCKHHNYMRHRRTKIYVD